MGQTQATKEAVWLKSLLNEIEKPIPIQFPDNITPSAPSVHSMHAVIINCDNQGAAALARNPQAHARSKHIDIKWHYQWEKIEDGSVVLRYIPTDQQIADGLTKPLPKNKFLAFRNALRLENKAVDIEDVGALILIPPSPLLYYIVPFSKVFLYSKVVFYHSPRGDE